MFNGLYYGYVPAHLIVIAVLELLGCAAVLFGGIAAARTRPRALVAALGGLAAGVTAAVQLIILVAVRSHHYLGFVDWIFRHEHAEETLDWLSGIGLLLIGIGFVMMTVEPRRRSRSGLAPDVL